MYAHVAKSVKDCTRVQVSWSHHREVAKFSDDPRPLALLRGRDGAGPQSKAISVSSGIGFFDFRDGHLLFLVVHSVIVSLDEALSPPLVAPTMLDGSGHGSV